MQLLQEFVVLGKHSEQVTFCWPHFVKLLIFGHVVYGLTHFIYV
jgi:hypothetical protein